MDDDRMRPRNATMETGGGGCRNRGLDDAETEVAAAGGPIDGPAADPTASAPDWRRCPRCGAAEFDLGYNRLGLRLDAQGRALAAAWGSTEVDWTSGETNAYFCGCCGEDLPVAHQRVLDGLLGNERLAR